VEVAGRLTISGNCALILDYHVALDRAREAHRGNDPIGTTGRESARPTKTRSRRRACAPRTCSTKALSERVREALEYHNFRFDPLSECRVGRCGASDRFDLKLGVRIRPMVADVSYRLDQAIKNGQRLLFEARGSLLDVDHGTYPYVTSSNTVAAAAAVGAGVGPQQLNYVLGITRHTRPGSDRAVSDRVDRGHRRAPAAARPGIRFGNGAPRAAAGSMRQRCAVRSS